MIKKLSLALLTAGIISVPAVATDTTEDLINALVTKGVLSEDEASLLSKSNQAETKNKAVVKDGSGLKITSSDGKNSIKLSGRVQLDYRMFDHDNDADTFDIRRAYLGVSGKIAEYYEYKLTGSFSDTTKLDEGFLNINWWKPVQFQFGQFKTPISLEERTSSRFTNFMERSYVNNASLTTGKEQGVMIHGNPKDWMGYGVAVVNGLGQNTDNKNGSSDNFQYIAHVDANLAKPFGYKNQVIHVGVNGSYWDADDENSKTYQSKQKTLARGEQFFSLSENSAEELTKTMYGLEGAWAVDNKKLQTEYAITEFDTGVNTQDLSAYYVEAGWILTGETYAKSYKTTNMGGKFDRIKPTKDFDPNTFSGGAWEVVAGYSKFDADDFTATSQGLTTTGATDVDTMRVGLNFIPQKNIKVMLNLVDTDFNGTKVAGETGEQAVILRMQYDF